MRSPSGSGSLVLVIMPNIWKVTAPNQMPNAIASPPMSVRPGILDEHSEAQLQVERQAAEPGGAAAIAHGFPVIVHAAERGERSATRFVARKPGLAHEAVRLHVEVKAELLVRARLARAGGTGTAARVRATRRASSWNAPGQRPQRH